MENSPPLIDDDGFRLWESRAILTYLASKYTKDETLYPTDDKERAHVNRLLFEDLEIYTKGIAPWLYPPIFAGVERDPVAEKKMMECFATLDRQLEGKKYLTGDNITIADCTVVSSLATLDAVDYDLSSLKNLHAYLEGFKSCDWYEEAQGSGIAQLKQMIADRKSQRE